MAVTRQYRIIIKQLCYANTFLDMIKVLFIRNKQDITSAIGAGAGKGDIFFG